MHEFDFLGPLNSTGSSDYKNNYISVIDYFFPHLRVMTPPLSRSKFLPKRFMILWNNKIFAYESLNYSLFWNLRTIMLHYLQICMPEIKMDVSCEKVGGWSKKFFGYALTLAYALIRPKSNLNCKNMVHIHRQSRPLDHNMHTTSTVPQKSEKMPIVIILIIAPCEFLYFWRKNELRAWCEKGDKQTPQSQPLT